ncbi:MAG: hypothetical protein U1A78_28430 [Polyangia bacterium]
MKRWLIEYLLKFDYLADGIRVRLFVAAAVLQVFLAPMWDLYLPYKRIAARMEPATFLATLLFMWLSMSLIGGRILALSMEDDDVGALSRFSLRRAVSVATGLVARYWRLMKLEPWPALVARLGTGLCVSVLALRGAVGLVRWCVWKLINEIESLLPSLQIWALPRAALESVWRAEQAALKLAVWVSIPVTLLAGWAFLRKQLRNKHPASLRDLRALAGIDPILERRDTRSHQSISAAFHGDLVGRLLQDLAQWTPSRAVYDEQSCRDDIAFFLRERRYEVAMERWIEGNNERRRVDLLVDQCIPIELKYALHDKGAGERDRARSQVECYAKMWGSAGPVLFFLAATPRTSAERYSDVMLRWNAALDGAKAPIVVLHD